MTSNAESISRTDKRLGYLLNWKIATSTGCDAKTPGPGHTHRRGHFSTAKTPRPQRRRCSTIGLESSTPIGPAAATRPPGQRSRGSSCKHASPLLLRPALCYARAHRTSVVQEAWYSCFAGILKTASGEYTVRASDVSSKNVALCDARYSQTVQRPSPDFSQVSS